MQIQQFIHLPSSPDKMLIFLELCQYPGTIIGTQLSSTRRHAPTSCLILRPHQEFKENCIPSYAGSACSRLRLLRCRHHHPPKSTLPTAACYCPLHLNPHDVQQLARNQQHHLPPGTTAALPRAPGALATDRPWRGGRPGRSDTPSDLVHCGGNCRAYTPGTHARKEEE
jgi:hypothetical protein